MASAAYMGRVHARLSKRLPIWVVYRPTTTDYSGQWLARMWLCLPKETSTRFIMLNDTLVGLRAMLPGGLEQMPRSPFDDLVIEEVWF